MAKLIPFFIRQGYGMPKLTIMAKSLRDARRQAQKAVNCSFELLDSNMKLVYRGQGGAVKQPIKLNCMSWGMR